MKGIVTVTLKQDILDPQGRAVKDSLVNLEFPEVIDVRIGKSVELLLDGIERKDAETRLHAMSKALLANPVIEDYRIEIMED